MNLVPPTQDNLETTRQLALFSETATHYFGRYTNDDDFDSDLELIFGSLFCGMHSTFEFGLRQVLHHGVFSFLYGADELLPYSGGGLKSLEKFLADKEMLPQTRSSHEWSVAKTLANVRNLYAHSGGWSNVNFEPWESEAICKIGFVNKIGFFPSGAVRRFKLTPRVFVNVQGLYGLVVDSWHAEMRSHYACT